MSQRIYSASISSNSSNRCTVHGTEEILNTAIDEWKDWLTNPAREENAFLEICGFCDNADRAEIRMVIKMECIEMFDVTHQWG